TRNVKFKFGTVGRMSLGEARVEARRLLSEMERGSDPLARKRKEAEDAARKGYTLRDALTAYLKGPVSERTRRDHTYAFKRHFDDWLDRPLVALTREAVRNRHERIARENGASTADTVMRYLRTVFNDAREIHEDLPEGITSAVKWR